MITNRIYLKNITLFFVSLILLGVISTVVLAAVSQVPLFLTSGAEPNVIFLMDSSGSMWNICWHKDYPADASADAYPAWFSGFFDGANDNMVLKYDTNISRYVLYFKANNWDPYNTSGDPYTGTGSDSYDNLPLLTTTTPLPPAGQSYIYDISQSKLFASGSVSNTKYNKVIIADSNKKFWVGKYNFKTSTSQDNGVSQTSVIVKISGNNTTYTYLKVDNTVAGSNATGAVLSMSNEPSSSSSSIYSNTWYTGSYLNWLFLAGNSSASARTQISDTVNYPQYQTTRLRAAKNAIESTINSTLKSDNSSKYRWGGYTYAGRLTTFYVSDTSADIATLKSKVEGVWPSGGTPLGNEIISIWNDFKSNPGPTSSRCQKNFLIVVTDGYPHVTDDAGSISTDPNDFWYNPAFPQGTAQASNYRSKAHIVTQVMHQGQTVAKTINSVTSNISISVDTFVIGLSFQGDPTTNRITDQDSLLYKMANNGNGIPFGVTDSVSLSSALANTMNTIASRIASASSVAVNTAYITTSTMLYRTKFNSGDWIGYLEAYTISQTDGSVASTPSWEAGMLLESNNSRHIYTTGAFSTSGNYPRLDFTTSNKTSVVSAGLALASDNSPENLISYIRGDSTPTGYRIRDRKLGDMTYSAPVICGPPDGFYTDNGYQAFKTSHANRSSRIIIGANDGMLHAFNASSGAESWAFIPNSLLPKLKLLAAAPYVHQNYVDGTPTIGDAFIKSKDSSGASEASAAWHTVLVCGLREGGSSYFALDITDPDNPIPLWEITPSSPSSNGLGYTFGTPLILKLKDTSNGGFRWVAALPNGYQGTASGKSASLIIVDLSTGSILKEIVVDKNTNGTSQNGLSSPSAVDTNYDGLADYIYAGDLKGHLWKFDVSGDGAGNWGSSYKNASGDPIALFYATDSGSNSQPITTAPDLVLREGFQIIFFGTGKYFEDGDKTTTQTQSFYGLYDYNVSDSNPSANGKYSRSNLVGQTLSQTTVTQGSTTTTYRYFSSTTSFTPDNTNSTKKGWYVDLPSSGERVITDPIAHAGRIIFTTFIPNTDECSFGGTSWLMELDQQTGGTISDPAFDVYINQAIDSGDKISGTNPVGISLGDGGASTPTIVGGGKDSGGTNIEYKYITKTTGELIKVLEGSGKNGAQLTLRSWRQLR